MLAVSNVAEQKVEGNALAILVFDVLVLVVRERRRQLGTSRRGLANQTPSSLSLQISPLVISSTEIPRLSTKNKTKTTQQVAKPSPLAQGVDEFHLESVRCLADLHPQGAANPKKNRIGGTL